MERGRQHGYMLLADISGYTPFMAGTELEHSNAILREFISLLIQRLTSVFTLAEVEGDAVFVYGRSATDGRGETLVELIEDTYLRFRTVRDVMKERTSCSCTACAAIPTLDLKFIMHAGEFILQEYDGRMKPVGSDVNLSHRLLKNSVSTATGWQAYSLFTEPALKAMGFVPDNAFRSTEAYEHLPSVEIYAVDLHDRYREINKPRRFELPDKDIHQRLSADIAAPPHIVWEWLHDPSKKSLWSKDGEWRQGKRAGGRTDVGAENHCSHGKGEAVETVLDWKPFEYFAAETVDGLVRLCMVATLKPRDGVTTLELLLSLRTPLPRFLERPLGAFLLRKIIRLQDAVLPFKRLVEESVADISASTPA